MAEVPSQCRVEYLTRKGWVVAHAAAALLHPARYVERLEDNGKVGRVTILNPDLTPTDQVWVCSRIPDPDDIPESVLERLVHRNEGNPDIPVLVDDCDWCLGTICDGDGTCLLG